MFTAIPILLDMRERENVCVHVFMFRGRREICKGLEDRLKLNNVLKELWLI